MTAIKRQDWAWYDQVKDFGIVADEFRQLALLRKLFDAINGTPLERYFVEPKRPIMPTEEQLRMFTDE